MNPFNLFSFLSARGRKSPPAGATHQIRLQVERLEEREVPASASIPFSNFADVRIQVDAPAQVYVGDTAKVSVTLSNSGPGYARNNQAFLDMPLGAAIDLSATTPGVLTWQSGDDAVLKFHDLAPGQSQTVTIGMVPFIATQLALTTATAWTGSWDYNPFNNTARDNTRVRLKAADLSVTLSGPSQVEQGANALYTATVKNVSPGIAPSTTLNITIPAGYRFNPAESSAGGRQIGNQIVFSLGSLSGGGEVVKNISFTASLANRDVRFVTASVATAVPESSYANNVARIRTNVVAPAPSVGISLSGDSHVYLPDQHDALLTNLTFSVSGNQTIGVQNLFVVISNHHASPVTPSVDEMMKEIHLRDPLTGRTVKGYPVSGAANQTDHVEVYHFSDFMITNGQTFQIVGDFNPNEVRPGDTIAAGIVTTPVGGGLVHWTELQPPTADYNLNLRTLTGARVNNINPQGFLQGNPQVIAEPRLAVAVQSLGTSDTVLKNQKNVTFHRFEVRADADVLLTQFQFVAQQGNLLDAQNYTLWVDTDQDGVVDTKLQSGVTVTNGTIIFDSIISGGYVTPAGKSTVYEVKGDMIASPLGALLQIGFATNSSSYLEAQLVANGSSLVGINTNGTGTGQITVTTTPSITYTIVAQGNLYVTQDPTPLPNRQLLAGALGDTILQLSLRAEYEDISVTDLQFESVTGPLRSVERLDLYFAGATTPFASATLAGAGSDLVAPGTFVANLESNQLVVQKGTDVVIVVRPRLKTDANGAISGEVIQLRINPTAVANNATGEGAVRSRGLQSANNQVANNGDSLGQGEVFIGRNTPGVNAPILSHTNDVVGAKVTAITNANPATNGTDVPTGVSAFGQFTFSAAANANSQGGLNKAGLNAIAINVNAANVAIQANSLAFYNKADVSQKVYGIAYDLAGNVLTGTITGSFVVVFNNLYSGGMNTVINSGANETFVLEGNIVNPKVNGALTSSLQASLQNFSNRQLPIFGSLSSLSHLEWFDIDAFTNRLFRWFEYPDTVVNSTAYRS